MAFLVGHGDETWPIQLDQVITLAEVLLDVSDAFVEGKVFLFITDFFLALDGKTGFRKISQFLDFFSEFLEQKLN